MKQVDIYPFDTAPIETTEIIASALIAMTLRQGLHEWLKHESSMPRIDELLDSSEVFYDGDEDWHSWLIRYMVDTLIASWEEAEVIYALRTMRRRESACSDYGWQQRAFDINPGTGEPDYD